MRGILDAYLSIRAASAVVNLPQYVLRCGCRDGTIRHVRHNNRLYIDMVALLDKLDTDNGWKSPGKATPQREHRV